MRVGLNLTQFIPGQSGGVQSYIENLVRELLRDRGPPHRFVLFTNYHTLPLFEALPIGALRGRQRRRPDSHGPLNLIGRFVKSVPFRAYCRGLKRVLRGCVRRRPSLPDGLHHPDRVPRADGSHVAGHPAGEFIPSSSVRRSCAGGENTTPPSARKATTHHHDLRLHREEPRRCVGNPTRADHDRASGLRGRVLPSRPRVALARPTFPERFFFYPAAFWPHKNHRRLFRGRRTAQRATRSFRLPLLLCGMNAADDAAARAAATRPGDS